MHVHHNARLNIERMVLFLFQQIQKDVIGTDAISHIDDVMTIFLESLIIQLGMKFHVCA